MDFIPTIVGKRVSVNLRRRFKYFHHCHIDGVVINKQKIHVQKPLDRVIKVTPKEFLPLPVVEHDRNWDIGKIVLVKQCIDSYWTWWEAKIIGRVNDRAWKIKWIGQYDGYDDVVEVPADYISDLIS